MSRKRYTPEQIIGNMVAAEVACSDMEAVVWGAGSMVGLLEAFG